MKYKIAALFFCILTGTIAFTYHGQKAHAQALPSLPHYAKSITFKVADVKPVLDTIETLPYKNLVDDQFVQTQLRAAEQVYYSKHGNTDNFVKPAVRIECFSRDREPLAYPGNNGFYRPIFVAYAEHRPLVLSPDMVWLAIMQGFSVHVNQNAEALRHHFVQHEGKKVLEVKMDGHVQLGRDDSDWEWVFGQFKEQIGQQTSPVLADLAAGRFSGTNTDAAVAFDITLMAATREYFDYWGSLMCGIPEITLEGSPEDWAQIEERASKLAKYDLEWWVSSLQPILAQFTRASKGDIDRPFWQNMVKIYEKDVICSTERLPTGWFLHFFPYIFIDGKDLVRNPMLTLKTEQVYAFLSEKDKSKWTQGDYICDNDVRRSIKYTGPEIYEFLIPEGVSTCTFNVDNNGNLIKMQLKAGFFGMRQDPKTMALRPVIGWAILDTGEKPDAADIKRYEKHQEKTSGN